MDMLYINFDLVAEADLSNGFSDNQVRALPNQNELILYETYNQFVNVGQWPCYIGSNENKSITSRTKSKLQGARELGFWYMLNNIRFMFYKVQVAEVFQGGHLGDFRYLDKKDDLVGMDVEHLLIRWWSWHTGREIELHQQDYVWEPIVNNFHYPVVCRHRTLGERAFVNGRSL